MRFGPESVARLSRLFDEAVALAADERQSWLQALPPDAQALREALQSMLARHAQDGPGALLTSAGAQVVALDESGLAAGDAVGRYRLESLLGRGGMGEVWRAEQADGRVRRTVALKLPHTSLPGPVVRAHFQRERDILAALDHPCIAKLYDAGVTETGQPFLALQFVTGVPITRHCDAAALGVAQRVRLFIELLDAVQHAHAALVIHRDIKPANVFAAESGRVMLLDFGIGKLLPRRETDSPRERDGEGGFTDLYGAALTPDYASPEQIAGRPVGTGSDIYSLGVLLYELLCGERPYRLQRAGRAALEEAILEQEIAPPSRRVHEDAARHRGTSARALARALRGDLDAIVRMAMAREPGQRYATAQAFAHDLERWLRKEPVQAQPDRLGYRARRFLARRWRGVAIAAGVAGMLAAAAIVAQHQAAVARAQRAQAQDEARKAQAVTAFLQDLLTQNSLAQPDPGAARRRTAEQLLDDGANRIRDSLAEAPEARLDLLRTMAMMYIHLRLPAKGLQLLELRARQADALYGPGDARSVDAWQSLAVQGWGTSTPAYAQRAMERLEPHLARLETSTDTAQRQQVADLLFARVFSLFRQDVKGGIAPADRLTAVLRTLPVPADPERLAARQGMEHILGVTYFQNLRLAQAEAHFSQADRLLERLPPGTERERASHPAWHAKLLDLVGRHADAEAMFARAHALERHGDALAPHVEAWVLQHWVQAKVEGGQVRQALALAFTGAPDGAGPWSAPLATSPNALLAQAQALAADGRGRDALAKAQAALSVWRQRFPEAAPLSIDPEQAEAWLALGQLAPAESALQRWRASLEAANELEGLRARRWHLAMVRLRVAQRDAAAARAALEHARFVLAPPAAGERQRLLVQSLEEQVRRIEERTQAVSRR